MPPAFRHVYIHIPFCEVICHYCDFYKVRAKEASYGDFFDALLTEARSILDVMAPRLDAIYFGGGSPSTAEPAQIRAVLDLFRDRIHAGTEVTLEANPRDISREKVRAWKEAGVNRISLGIQALNDQILKRVGRAHNSAGAIRALETCLAELENVTGDLIYGVPEQALDGPASHALELAKLGLKHFSAYHLSVSPRHFLHSKLPEESFAVDQIQLVVERLAPLGFRQYEIANFGLPGFESRNNLNYWKGGPYQALGPSAHGFDGTNVRWQNIPDWKEYVNLIRQGKSPVHFREELSNEQRTIESIFTGLRLDEGLDLKRIESAFGCDILRKNAALFEAWEKEGLGTLDGGIFVPTFKGRMLADEITRKLL